MHFESFTLNLALFLAVQQKDFEATLSLQSQEKNNLNCATWVVFSSAIYRRGFPLKIDQMKQWKSSSLDGRRLNWWRKCGLIAFTLLYYNGLKCLRNKATCKKWTCIFMYVLLEKVGIWKGKDMTDDLERWCTSWRDTLVSLCQYFRLQSQLMNLLLVRLVGGSYEPHGKLLKAQRRHAQVKSHGLANRSEKMRSSWWIRKKTSGP